MEYVRTTAEVGKRRLEALNLYDPLPFQDEYHKCTAREVIIQKGNRAGGSLAGFVEDARAVTGQDPYDKYPKRDGVLICLGYGEKHIGRVIHKYLFRAGAFQIIRDKITKKWRVYRPWPEDEGGDLSRASEAKPAPPLIPNRFVEGKLAWTKRSENIFSMCRLTTGWEIHALNSVGDPNQAQGFDVDLYHIDEDVEKSGWYTEALARTMVPHGRIRWTALPHSKTDDIVRMIERAGEQAGSEKPTTVCIRATMWDNPFMPKESRDETVALYREQGEEEYRKRVLGELVTDHVSMYPTFDSFIHGAIKDKEPMTEIQNLLTERRGLPPRDWCRYMTVDPGHGLMAALLFAVPPPDKFGDYVVCYDECMVRQADARKFADAIAPKIRDFVFQDFIMDAHGGRIRELASGILPKHQYEEQFKLRNLKSVASGYYFRNGSDDVRGREMKVREWLSIRPNGTTKLLIVAQMCPTLCKQLKSFKKITKRVGGQMVPTDQGNRRANVDAVESLEYMAAHGAKYVKPKVSANKSSWVKRALKARNRREAQRRARNGSGRTFISLASNGRKR